MTLPADITTARLRYNFLVNASKLTKQGKRNNDLLTESDSSVIASIRIVLTLATFLVFFTDPSRLDRSVTTSTAHYFVLVSYLVYSLTLYFFATRQRQVHRLQGWAHWVDAGWYMLLVLLSSSLHVISFFGFYFAILVAALRWGFTSGIWVTGAVSIFLWVITGFPSSPHQWQLGGVLLHPVYLLLPGYLIALWGESVRTLSRRLTFLKELAMLANVQFDVQRVSRQLTQRLQDFYDAESCWLIPAEQGLATDALLPQQHLRLEGTRSLTPTVNWLVRQLALLAPKKLVASCGDSQRWKWWCSWMRGCASEVLGDKCITDLPGQSLIAANTGQSSIILPVRYRGEVVAYLYLVIGRRHAFRISDIDFLHQVSESIVLILQNIQLLSDSAKEERRRIGRDLHDSVIQSYLGLQIGLTALHEKLIAGEADVRSGLEHLIGLANAEVADLRRYVGRLQNGHKLVGDLSSAVGDFASKFAKATGMTVQVEAETDVRIHGRLATEVFYIVAEGLSNIKRHTDACRAIVRLACRESCLTLRIENDDLREWAPFTPRSITERVTELGGNVQVEKCEGKGTIVTVTIPC